MARELACPECPQVLTVPDSMLGQTVRCPQCGGVFRTTPEGGITREAPAPVPTYDPPPLPVIEPSTIPCPFCREPIPREALRCPYCNEATRVPASTDEDDRPEEYIRRDVIPHRGNLVMLLGILSLCSLVIAFCPPLCVIGVGLGSAAWMMANADLRKIGRGDMDPGGEGSTYAGKICGIIGLILNGLIVLTCGAYGVAMLASMYLDQANR